MSRQVLIIEDEAVLARNMVRFLTRLGFEVHTAPSTFDAAHALRKLDVHAIVIDINLPDGDGLAFFRDIQPRFPNVDVIVISGHLNDEQQRCAEELGVKGVLIKPFALASLAALLAEDCTADRYRDEPSPCSLNCL